MPRSVAEVMWSVASGTMVRRLGDEAEVWECLENPLTSQGNLTQND